MLFIANITQDLNGIGVPLDSLLSFNQQVFSLLSTFLGGLFGLYLVFFLLRFISERKMLKELRAIKGEVKSLRECVSDHLVKKK